jgi:4-cresol dehydrogenase (hydroxylating)
MLQYFSMNSKILVEKLIAEGWKLSQIRANYSVSDVSGYTAQNLLFLSPESRVQVKNVLSLANAFKVSVYPFSRGNNWAFGGRVPYVKGSILVDLSRMSSIEDFDAEFGTIRIEPGVSQGQLCSYLKDKNSKYYLDVTGSGVETSVLGNTLERGIAYNSLRAQSLLAMEVMLPDGSVVNTGFSGNKKCDVSSSYGYGLGPDLRGLFLQSNYGIVLSIVIKLERIQEQVLSFQVSVSEARVGELIDSLSILLSDGVLSCIPHIGDPLRVRSTIEPIIRGLPGIKHSEVEYVLRKLNLSDVSVPIWSCLGSIQGPVEIIQAKKALIRKKLARLGDVKFIDEKKIAIFARFFNWGPFRPMVFFLKGTASLRGLVQGESTSDALKMMNWNPGGFQQNIVPKSEAFEDSTYGVIFSVPLTKMTGFSAHKIISHVRAFSADNHLILGMTFNALNSSVLEAVISFHFDPTSTNLEEIHSLFAKFNRILIDDGIFPYRMNPDLIKVCWDIVPHKELSSSLKVAMDPNNIMSPGHYVRFPHL